MTQESKGRDQKGFENFPSPYWKKIFLSDFLIPGVVSCFSFEVKHPKHVHDAQFCTSASILQLSLDKEGLVSYHHSHHSVVPGPTQKSDRWHI